MFDGSQGTKPANMTGVIHDDVDYNDGNDDNYGDNDSMFEGQYGCVCHR